MPGTPALDIGGPWPPLPLDDINGRFADVPGALYAVIKGFPPPYATPEEVPGIPPLLSMLHVEFRVRMDHIRK